MPAPDTDDTSPALTAAEAAPLEERPVHYLAVHAALLAALDLPSG